MSIEQPTPKRESEMRKEAILEQLDSQVSTLCELDDLFDSVGPDESPEETKHKIDAFKKKLLADVSPETLTELPKLQKGHRAMKKMKGLLQNSTASEIFRRLSEEEKNAILEVPKEISPELVFL